MKNIVKFKHDEHEGFLSVVEKDGAYYTLVQKTTPKVNTVKHTGKVMISFDLKNPEYNEIDASIIEDMKVIKEVYDQLEKDKNLYFKALTEDLCVLKFYK